ncbi:MAG TPA: YrdB family protein [Ktedonobacteraceae bacterium]|nr:YrdB family protein [Ktedonobacteraceae bacterium]
MITALKYSNLALSFLLELCILGALAYWGFRVGNGTLMKIVLGIGTPLLAALVWGIFEAPQAWIQLPNPWHLLLALVIFGLAVIALYVAGQPTLALIFAFLVAINQILIYVWHQ